MHTVSLTQPGFQQQENRLAPSSKSSASALAPPIELGDSTMGVATAGVSFSKGNLESGTPTPLRKEIYVLLLRGKRYLRSYASEEGIWSTADINSARLFHSLTSAQGLAKLFEGTVVTVHLDENGLRRTLLNRGDEERNDDEEEHQGQQGMSANHDEDGERSQHNTTVINNPVAGEVGPKKGGGGQPPSFLVRALLTTRRAQLSDGKRLLGDFISAFLNVEFLDFQSSGSPDLEDLLSFRCPHSGSTLYLRASVLLETRELAEVAVQNKLAESVRKFKAATRERATL